MESDTNTPDTNVPKEEELAPHLIEAARSSRSRCRVCRRKIDKEVLRLGILLEGPYGTGYIWHHLTCAAKRKFDDVEAAYGTESWAEGLEVPGLEELRKLREKSEEKKKKQKQAPYAERAPTGRSKCRHCGELIAKGDWRVGLLREVEFYGQTRSGPINVHAGCVKTELASPDCLTETDGFEDELRANSANLAEDEIAAALTAIDLD